MISKKTGVLSAVVSEYWNFAIMSSELGLWVGNPAMTSTGLMALKFQSW